HRTGRHGHISAGRLEKRMIVAVYLAATTRHMTVLVTQSKSDVPELMEDDLLCSGRLRAGHNPLPSVARPTVRSGLDKHDGHVPARHDPIDGGEEGGRIAIHDPCDALELEVRLEVRASSGGPSVRRR